MKLTKANHRLVLGGGCLLAFGAAYVNTGFVIRAGVSVSHLTGDISRLGISLVSRHPEHLVNAAVVLLASVSFAVGAAISGFLLHHPQLDMRKPYGRILAVSGCALILAHVLLESWTLLAVAITGTVCGI